MTEHDRTGPNVASDEPNAADELWLNVTDLAAQLGLAKSSVSERLKGFVDAGQVATKPGPRGSVLVRVADYIKAAADHGDQARTLATKGAADEGESAAASYTRSQALEKSFKAELARLDLEERLGRVIPVDQVAAAATRIGDAIAQGTEQISSRAEECAAAVLKDGTAGARTFLRNLAHELRDKWAAELEHLARVGQAEHGGAGREAANE
jgi:DNA-binding MarR family transcriptional regulator